MMKHALIGLSFDDGREDTYLYGYPILKKNNLPATFNITMGFVKGVVYDFVDKDVNPMSEEMLKVLFRDPQIEIAGHGYLHKNSLKDITSGIKSLCELLGTEALYKGTNGFASPYSGLTSMRIQKLKKELQANNIAYVRLSLRYQSFKWLKILARKMSRVIKWPWLYRLVYQDTLMLDANEGVLYSIPVLSSVTLGQLKAVIREAVRKKAACILMFHSIVEKGKVRDNWDYETDKFQELCSFLNDSHEKDELKVMTSMDIYNRLK